MMKNSVFVIAAVALMILSAACSAKAFPAGDYRPAASNTDTSATDFAFAANGTYRVAFYDGRTLAGTYTVSGDKLTLNDSKDGPCFGSPMTMSWTSTGNTLAMKSVEDTCSVGLSFEWVGEWAKQP